MRYGTENEYLGMVAQAGSYKILMYMLYVSPRGKEVHIFYRKKSQLQNLSTQKESLCLWHTPERKSRTSSVLVKNTIPKKIPGFFLLFKKIPMSFIDPKKSLLAKISDPKKSLGDPPASPQCVSKICEWCPFDVSFGL